MQLAKSKNYQIARISLARASKLLGLPKLAMVNPESE